MIAIEQGPGFCVDLEDGPLFASLMVGSAHPTEESRNPKSEARNNIEIRMFK